MGRLVVAVVALRPQLAGTQEGDAGCRRVLVAPSPGSGRSWVGVGGSNHQPHRRPLCSSVTAPHAARLPLPVQLACRSPCSLPPASKLSGESTSRPHHSLCAVRLHGSV
ncbi:hypothetical protein VPH35_030875 [Triticum aestivum]